jgi:hypothetical protein
MLCGWCDRDTEPDLFLCSTLTHAMLARESRWMKIGVKESVTCFASALPLGLLRAPPVANFGVTRGIGLLRIP